MNLIEKIEQETGKRWNDPSGLPLAQLIGAVARETGVSKFEERDDIAVGVLLRDEFINGDRRRQTKRALLAMINLLGPSGMAQLFCK